MPLYEYGCAKCGKVHEVIQKFSDAPLTACPDCQGPVEKMVSLGSFALKGSGWYTTDYKRKAPVTPGAPSGEAKPDSKPSGDGKGSSETKPGGDAKGSSEGKGSSDSNKGSSDSKGSGDSKGAGAKPGDAKSSAPSPQP